MSVELDNERFLNILSNYLNFDDTLVKKEEVESVAECGVDKSTAFCYVLAEKFGVDSYGVDRQFFNDYFLPSIKELNILDYTNDEYYKCVKFNGESVGKSTLKYMTCKAYQAFVRDDFLYFDNGKVLPQIGFFSSDYLYPAVLTDDRVWMTLLPNEINSQKKYIQNAYGYVLTYGLGLGYYVFMCALKDNVTRVDVVDIDKNVIDLFTDKIMSNFPKKVKDKIHIINKDAFLYAKTPERKYDYVYADIWHDCQDGAPMYKKFKSLEKYMPDSEFGYWIEDSIKYYL